MPAKSENNPQLIEASHAKMKEALVKINSDAEKLQSLHESSLKNIRDFAIAVDELPFDSMRTIRSYAEEVKDGSEQVLDQFKDIDDYVTSVLILQDAMQKFSDYFENKYMATVNANRQKYER